MNGSIDGALFATGWWVDGGRILSLRAKRSNLRAGQRIIVGWVGEGHLSNKISVIANNH
jgi:hypothetical protein